MEVLGRDVIEKIEDLVKKAESKENSVVEVDGKQYWTDTKKRVYEDWRHDTIKVSSLSSIVTYIKDHREGFKQEDLFIHVESPESVSLYEKATGEFKRRTHIISAGMENYAEVFPFGKFMSTEEFIIGLLSLFEDDGDRNDIVTVAGNLRSEKSLQNTDDGATTKYDAHHGVVCTLPGMVIPQVVVLYPFRTFRQITQPGSTFVFRYRADDTGVITVGLFEADGGAWKHEAMISVEKYFKEFLPEVQVIA